MLYAEQLGKQGPPRQLMGDVILSQGASSAVFFQLVLAVLLKECRFHKGQQRAKARLIDKQRRSEGICVQGCWL